MSARVLEAITPRSLGGAELFTVGLSEYLNDSGALAGIFCPTGRKFVTAAHDRGLPVTTWGTLGKLDPITVFRLAALIRRTQADVIHTHLSTASLLGAFAARLARVPSIAHVHGLNSAACFRHSDRIIAVSSAVKSHLCSQGIPSDKVAVCYNGVDMERYQPTPREDGRAAVGLDRPGPCIGVFGRLSPEKGQYIALEALALIARERPETTLLLVGRGAEESRLREAAARLSVAENVVFAGFQADVRPWMAACDLVVVPSVKEGFGLSAVEAMAMERPVIASRTGGLVEIIEDGQTGLLFAPADPAQLARSALRVLEDAELATAFGRAARRRAADMFDSRKQFSALYAILDETAKVGAVP